MLKSERRKQCTFKHLKKDVCTHKKIYQEQQRGYESILKIYGSTQHQKSSLWTDSARMFFDVHEKKGNYQLIVIYKH